MRKLAPARVSYRHDFLISCRVHVDKMHVRFKIANITHALPVPVYRQTDQSHRNEWSFRIYMIPLRDFVPEWNSRSGTTTGVNSRRGDSRRHDILLWYHVTNVEPWQGTGVNSGDNMQPCSTSKWQGNDWVNLLSILTADLSFEYIEINTEKPLNTFFSQFVE